MTLLLAIIGGLVAAHFLAVVAAGLWERRPVQTYVVPPPEEMLPRTATATSQISLATQLGYEHTAAAQDGKGRIYRVRYDFLISPDLTTLAVIGGGTIASIPVDGVWLWSRCADGGIVGTTNDSGEQDISGIVDQRTLPQQRFDTLAKSHAKRLAAFTPLPFPEDQPLRGHFEIRRTIADALVDRGYAYYLNEERTAWRYTLFGSLAFYTLTVWLRPLGRFFRSQNRAGRGMIGNVTTREFPRAENLTER